MKHFAWISLVGLLLASTTVVQAQEKNPVVLMSTSMGDVTIELNPQKAPVTVKNFLGYVEKKHFDGLIFHRVIKNFMIQGGGFDADFNEKKTNDPIKLESANGLTNDRGTIAMARTNVPDSATAQFFINVVDNPFLNGKNAGRDGYAVFGKVIKGMDVVDKIRAVPTGNKGFHQNVPLKPVTIKSIRLLKQRN